MGNLRKDHSHVQPIQALRRASSRRRHVVVPLDWKSKALCFISRCELLCRDDDLVSLCGCGSVYCETASVYCESVTVTHLCSEYSYGNALVQRVALEQLIVCVLVR